MTTSARTLVNSKTVEAAQTTQYTSTSVRTIIDKFTCTNYSGSVVQISVNIVPSGGSASTSNQIVRTKSIQPNETYLFPELVGTTLDPGDFISTLAGTGSALNMRTSGRVIS